MFRGDESKPNYDAIAVTESRLSDEELLILPQILVTEAWMLIGNYTDQGCDWSVDLSTPPVEIEISESDKSKVCLHKPIGHYGSGRQEKIIIEAHDNDQVEPLVLLHRDMNDYKITDPDGRAIEEPNERKRVKYILDSMAEAYSNLAIEDADNIDLSKLITDKIDLELKAARAKIKKLKAHKAVAEAGQISLRFVDVSTHYFNSSKKDKRLEIIIEDQALSVATEEAARQYIEKWNERFIGSFSIKAVADGYEVPIPFKASQAIQRVYEQPSDVDIKVEEIKNPTDLDCPF